MATAPCPFCGYHDPYIDEFQLPEENDPSYFLVCPQCECEGPMADSVAAAFERWNTRV